MTRYVAIARFRRAPHADYEDDYPHLPELRVYEDDDPQETGLLDKNGNSIYRVRERGKVGF